MELIDTLNRTMKLAMDEGLVDSYEEAQALFSSFRLRIVVQPGFTAVHAAEAAVLTLLNSAPKTFLGGVDLVGPTDELCTRAWFAGLTLGEVAQDLGVTIGAVVDEVPTIYVGGDMPETNTFCLGISLQREGFTLSPDRCEMGTSDCFVEAGVAAAGAALNEAFQHVYRKSPVAGQRQICWKFPDGGRVAPLSSVWLIGLGHLGQAFLWTAVLAGGNYLPQTIRLSDFDKVSRSSLSTSLLVKAKDIGREKVTVVAEQLELLGVRVERDNQRLELNSAIVQSAQELVVVAVDNVALRRSLDLLRAKRLLEGGIGDGADAFTRIQLHAFPGPRKARDVWAGDDARAARAVDISKPAYQSLVAESGNQCGVTMIAGRSIATPFVGAFAGALLGRLALDSSGVEYAWNFDVSNL
jgi:hypothetical protein